MFKVVYRTVVFSFLILFSQSKLHSEDLSKTKVNDGVYSASSDIKKTKLSTIDTFQKIIVTALLKSKRQIESIQSNISDVFGGIFYDNIDKNLYIDKRTSDAMRNKIFENTILISSPVNSSKSLRPSSLFDVR